MNQEEILKQAAQVASSQPQMPVGPIPMNWSIAQAQGPNGLLIVVGIQTQQGNSVFFLEPDIGKKLGEALTRLSSAAETGLVIP